MCNAGNAGNTFGLDTRQWSCALYIAQSVFFKKRLHEIPCCVAPQGIETFIWSWYFIYNIPFKSLRPERLQWGWWFRNTFQHCIINLHLLDRTTSLLNRYGCIIWAVTILKGRNNNQPGGPHLLCLSAVPKVLKRNLYKSETYNIRNINQ